jgi:hypothetical protein
LQETMRNMNSENKYIGSISNNGIYANQTDPLKETMRQITDEIPRSSIISGNTLWNVVQPTDILNPTIKEISVENKLNPFIVGNNKSRVYNVDDLRTTMKEVNEPISSFTISPNNQIYANISNPMQTTLKDVYSEMPINNMVLPIQKMGTSNYTDETKTTMKQITTEIPQSKFMAPNVQKRTAELCDIPKQTLRETLDTQIQSFTLIPSNIQRKPDITHPLNTTMKETIVNDPNHIITSIKGYQTSLMDDLKTTMKELNVDIMKPMQILPVDQFKRPIDISHLNTTQKEINETLVRPNFVIPKNQAQTTHLTDPTKTTIREITSIIPTNTNIFTNSKRPVDISNLNSTMKETMEYINRPSFIAPVNQTKQTAHHSDELKRTMKETLNNSNFTTITNNIGSTVPYSDVAKTTTKETLIDIPYNSYLSGNSRGKSIVFDGNPLKTTSRETTMESSRLSMINNSNQGMKSNISDIARTTMKELNIDIPYSTQITGNEQGKGSSFNSEPLKTTNKETLSNNERIGQLVSNKNSGYLIENMIAPETHRQDTCLKTRINPLNGLSKSTVNDSYYNSIVNHKNKKIHVYRPPTTCNVFMGPDAENLHYKLKDDSSYSRLSNPYQENTFGRLKTNFALRDDSKDISDRFINPKLLKQLESNPYNIDVNN